MAWGRVCLVAILAAVLSACGAIGTPSPVAISLQSDAATVTTGSPITTPGASYAATASPPSASHSPTAQPAAESTPVPLPPKPTGVKFDEQRRLGNDASSTEVTQTVTWAAPRSEGVEIRVYGVTRCIAEPASPSPGSGGPCLVEHTPLPAEDRTLLATGPASAGDVSWSWTGTSDCEGPGLASDPRGPAYDAVVLAAYSASGHSIFAIAAPGRWARPGPGEVIC